MSVQKGKSSITFRGLEFDFNYRYTSGYPATYMQPEEQGEFDIFNVEVNGVCANDILDRYWDEFEEDAVNHLIDVIEPLFY